MNKYLTQLQKDSDVHSFSASSFTPLFTKKHILCRNISLPANEFNPNDLKLTTEFDMPGLTSNSILPTDTTLELEVPDLGLEVPEVTPPADLSAIILDKLEKFVTERPDDEIFLKTGLRQILGFFFQGPTWNAIKKYYFSTITGNPVTSWNAFKESSISNFKFIKECLANDPNSFWLQVFLVFFIVWDVIFRIQIRENVVEKNKFCGNPFPRIILFACYIFSFFLYLRMWRSLLCIFLPWTIPVIEYPLIKALSQIIIPGVKWFESNYLWGWDLITMVDGVVVMLVFRLRGSILPMYQRYHMAQLCTLLSVAYTGFEVYKLLYSVFISTPLLTLFLMILFHIPWFLVYCRGTVDAIRGTCWTGNALDDVNLFLCNSQSLCYDFQCYYKWEDYGIDLYNKWDLGSIGERRDKKKEKEKKAKERKRKKKEKKKPKKDS